MVSATNRNLEEAIEDGDFRRDLYYRLKVVTVDLPPLRERREDIVPLVDHFRKQFAKRHHKPVERFAGRVSRRLFAYDWPGNVRQLRNAVETMVVLDIGRDAGRGRSAAGTGRRQATPGAGRPRAGPPDRPADGRQRDAGRSSRR